ncbi:hypothetical protein A1O1_08648 [Capronia coronata CBS 617.96]|uniref:Xylanolytic transcriptional activator regulatory domain-containing protein n=1 Tax=Capronia coronata CBS 617.96 TaxID=1182541 RepID=W9XJY1_9EURO|nr:uncharacterized protein A1O1_08648 [Capronia coronata CBS 617.96]EXJ80503.1 hypothetical protein A1O1_08648 [Capronia coronata CBS 617.96]
MSWRSSGYKSCSATTKVPEPEDESSTHALLFYDGRVVQLVGFTGEHDPYLLRHAGYGDDSLFTCANLTYRRVITQQPFPLLFMISRNCTEAEETRRMGHALDTVESIIKPYGSNLLKLYWRYVNPCYPIIYQRRYIIRHLMREEKIDPALMAAMYLSALQWWDFDPSLSAKPRPDEQALRHFLDTTLAHDFKGPKLVTVQALLLYSQAPVTNPKTETQIVAVAQQLGLHLDSSTWSIPPWERKVRKIVWWAVYIQEKWQVSPSPRPSHIPSSGWNVPLPNDLDFIEEGKTLEDFPIRNFVTGARMFQAMATMTVILAEILDTFFSLPRVLDVDYSLDEALQLANPLRTKLYDWRMSLLPCLEMDAHAVRELNICGSWFRSLHLCYHACQMAISRALTRTKANDIETAAACWRDAQASANNVVDFVQSLTPEHLQSFWYSFCQANLAMASTFLVSVLLTSGSDEQFQEMQQSIEQFRWILTIQARHTELMGHALARLDSLLASQEAAEFL